jgi:hypothetical protein
LNLCKEYGVEEKLGPLLKADLRSDDIISELEFCKVYLQKTLGLNLWIGIAQLPIDADPETVSLSVISSKLQKGLYNNGGEFKADMVKMYDGLEQLGPLLNADLRSDDTISELEF